MKVTLYNKDDVKIIDGVHYIKLNAKPFSINEDLKATIIASSIPLFFKHPEMVTLVLNATFNDKIEKLAIVQKEKELDTWMPIAECSETFQESEVMPYDTRNTKYY